MPYLRKEKQYFRIWLLQLQRHRPRFVSLVRSDLVQKRARGAKQITEIVKRQISLDMKKQSWRYAPRAKIAVTMHFRSKNNHIPALHNLVKFYLDPLRSVLFNDDRQVEYLTARCWRPSGSFENLNAGSDSVFITVERLAEYNRRLDLYFTLRELEEFRRYLHQDRRHQNLVDEDTGFELSDEKLLGRLQYYMPGLSDQTREELRRFEIVRLQEHLLQLNKIDRFDRPGGSKVRYSRNRFVEASTLQPFIVDLGDLPNKDESKQYKQRIRRQFQVLRQKLGVFGQILVPVELDVQVTPRTLKLGKDLDNIMREIVPAFHEELLQGSAYLHGYRIYVNNQRPIGSSSGTISLKLLSLNALDDFEDAVDETLKAAKEWLERKLSWNF